MPHIQNSMQPAKTCWSNNRWPIVSQYKVWISAETGSSKSEPVWVHSTPMHRVRKASVAISEAFVGVKHALKWVFHRFLATMNVDDRRLVNPTEIRSEIEGLHRHPPPPQRIVKRIGLFSSVWKKRTTIKDYRSWNLRGDLTWPISSMSRLDFRPCLSFVSLLAHLVL